MELLLWLVPGTLKKGNSKNQDHKKRNILNIYIYIYIYIFFLKTRTIKIGTPKYIFLNKSVALKLLNCIRYSLNVNNTLYKLK